MRSLALRCLRLYKRWISPSFPPSCRYTPTCSEYAMEAVEGHGVLHGTRLAAWRVLRCQPWAKGGLDPVPQLRSAAAGGLGRGEAGHASTATKYQDELIN